MSDTRQTFFRTVVAQRFIRKMRGGAQAHLIQANDGRCYVLKFRNNPQHRRVLINEAIGSALARLVGLSAAEPVLVSMGEQFLSENPDVRIETASRKIHVEPGTHFGSAYPVDPDRSAVFDLIPDVLLPKVANFGHFLGMLVFDQWVCNTDRRQCVFYRPPRTKNAGGPSALCALMVDQGSVFDGGNWGFPDSPLHGIYHQAGVYAQARFVTDFEPWLSRIESLSQETIELLRNSVPPEWLAGEYCECERLLETLWKRRARVRALLEDCLLSQPAIFPGWNRNQAMSAAATAPSPEWSCKRPQPLPGCRERQSARRRSQIQPIRGCWRRPGIDSQA